MGHDASTSRPDYLSRDEARQIYEALSKISIRMPAGAYAQRFLKWNMKASDPTFADYLRFNEFIDRDSHRDLTEIADLHSRKRVRLVDQGTGWAETGTIFEALIHVYQTAALWDEHGAKMMYRGQRDASWPIVSTRQRAGVGQTREFKAALRKCVRTERKWAFEEQLEGAAQHYGFPTDMIDFTMDADVAAYFATLNGKPGTKGAIYFTDATTEGAGVGLVFLPRIFHRLHRQAGVFFQSESFLDPDEAVIFTHEEDEFLVYDYRGMEFDPLQDDGPIPRLAEEVKRGVSTGSLILPAERETLTMAEGFAQELLCSWRGAKVVNNKELVWRVAASNLGWWLENIEDYVAHCRSDPNALSRALEIQECVRTIDARGARNLGLGGVPIPHQKAKVLTLEANERGELEFASDRPWIKTSSEDTPRSGVHRDGGSEGVRLGRLGNAYRRKGEIGNAIRSYQQALDKFREVGDRREEGVILGNLGMIHADLGAAEKAIEHFELALSIHTEFGHQRGQVNVLVSLGNAHADLANVRKAIVAYEQARNLARESNYRLGEGHALGGLASAYADLGHLERAIRYREKALLIVRMTGDLHDEADQLGNLANEYSALGENQKAIANYEEALAIAYKTGDRRRQGHHLGNLGGVFLEVGRVDEAIRHTEQARLIACETGDRRAEASWAGNLGAAFMRSGEVEKAIAFCEESLTAAREVGDRRVEANQCGTLSLAFATLGDWESATAWVEMALSIGREIGDPRIVGIASTQLEKLRDLGNE